MWIELLRIVRPVDIPEVWTCGGVEAGNFSALCSAKVQPMGIASRSSLMSIQQLLECHSIDRHY